MPFKTISVVLLLAFKYAISLMKGTLSAKYAKWKICTSHKSK